MLQRFILFAGAVVVAAAAAWASFSTLASLASATGWASGAWLLPTSIDVLGALACYVWLRKTFPLDARRFARATTFATIGISVIGNGVGHLVSSGLLSPSVLLIVAVGAVPPASLAALIHLIVLATSTPVPAKQVRRVGTEPSPALAVKKSAETPGVPGPAKPKPSPKPKSGTAPVKSGPDSGPVVDEVLMQRGRHLWDRYAAEGKHVTRDALKTELEIGTGKATPLLAALKKEKEVA